jgi:glycosyltransferase involved in cell wall biosynthesis
LIELLAALRGNNVKASILCTALDPFTERLEGTATVICETKLNTRQDWIRFYRRFRPDIVVLIYGELKSLPHCASVAARLAGVSKVYAIQHLVPPECGPVISDSWLSKTLCRLLGGKDSLAPLFCNKVICVSDAVRDALIKRYRFPRWKTITIHNGVSVESFIPDKPQGATIRERLGIGASELVIVCSARLSPEKGVDILLTAISRLIQFGFSCKCIIVGDGHWKEKLLEQTRELGLTPHVFFEGFQMSVQPYLCAADIFALTSHFEGLPFAVLEAMACGLPCVVSNVGGNAEAIHHKIHGMVVRRGSVDDVVDALRYLFTHPEARNQMSREARNRACHEFDIKLRLEDVKSVILA